jgi:hypothetical protein
MASPDTKIIQNHAISQGLLKSQYCGKAAKNKKYNIVLPRSQ